VITRTRGCIRKVVPVSGCIGDCRRQCLVPIPSTAREPPPLKTVTIRGSGAQATLQDSHQAPQQRQLRI
jgi:hypothetical protein